MTATPVDDTTVTMTGTSLVRRRSVALDPTPIREAVVPAVRRALDIAGAGLMLLVLMFTSMITICMQTEMLQTTKAM